MGSEPGPNCSESRYQLTGPFNSNSARVARSCAIEHERRSKGQKENESENRLLVSMGARMDPQSYSLGEAEAIDLGNHARCDTDPKNIVKRKCKREG